MSQPRKLLDDAEILKILQNSTQNENISITDWKITEKGGTITGFLGDYFCLKVKAKIGDKPIAKNFFVKAMPIRSQDNEFLQGYTLFKKEGRIYSEILAAMPPCQTRWTPKSYYTRDDIIVLDDVTEENFLLMPSHQDFTKDHVQLVLKSLAIMHANSFYLEKKVLKKPIIEPFKDILFEVSIEKDNIWFDRGVAAAKEFAMIRSRFTSDPEMVQWIKDNFDKEFSRIYDITYNYPKKFVNTFCHRDIWRNNLMYKFDIDNSGNIDYDKPLECLLFDYQIARYMPPGGDVVMTLYMLQRVSERKRDFQENINYYYETLKQSLKELGMKVEEILSFDELLETIDYFKLIGAVLKCIFLQMTHLPDGEMDKIHADEDAYAHFITVDRVETLVKFIDTDEYFKNWMIESVEELIEILLSDKK